MSIVRDNRCRSRPRVLNFDLHCYVTLMLLAIKAVGSKRIVGRTNEIDGLIEKIKMMHRDETRRYEWGVHEKAEGNVALCNEPVRNTVTMTIL